MTADAEAVVNCIKLTGEITRATTNVASFGPTFKQAHSAMAGTQCATVQAIEQMKQIGKTRAPNMLIKPWHLRN